MGGRLRQCSCAPIQQTNPSPLKQILTKNHLTTNLWHVSTHPQHPCKLWGFLHWYVASTMEYAMKGKNIRCVEGVCKRPFHVWHVLLIVCCDCCLVAAALVLTNTEPQNLKCPTTGAKSLAFIANQCLGRSGMWLLTRRPSIITDFLFSFTIAGKQNLRIKFPKRH